MSAGTYPFDSSTMFAPTSFWRAPLPADAPLLADTRWARNVCEQMDLVWETDPAARHPAQQPGAQAGNAWFSDTAGGSPLYVVGPATPKTKVHLNPPGTASDADLQKSWEAVPLPIHFVDDPQFVPGNSADKSVCIWQPATDTMWEFWGFHRSDGPDYSYAANWGGTMLNASTSLGVYRDLFDAQGRRIQWGNWGHTASSLPLNAGAIQPEELDRGYIGHALHLTVGWAASQFVWPARRTDGTGHWWKRADGTWGPWRAGATWLPYPDMVPEGCRLRFPADLDSSAYSGLTRMLVEAVRDYGIIVTDQTGNGCGIRFREDSTYKAAGAPSPWTSRIPLYPNEYMWAMPWHRLQVVDPAFHG